MAPALLSERRSSRAAVRVSFVGARVLLLLTAAALVSCAFCASLHTTNKPASAAAASAAPGAATPHSHDDRTETLCARVDDLLLEMTALLDVHKALLRNSAAVSALPVARTLNSGSADLDLAPIRRMWHEFGCSRSQHTRTGPHATPDEMVVQGKHKTRDKLQGTLVRGRRASNASTVTTPFGNVTTQTTPVSPTANTAASTAPTTPPGNASAEPMSISTLPLTTAAPATTFPSDMPIEPFECYLSSLINGTCEGPTPGGRLVVFFEPVSALPEPPMLHNLHANSVTSLVLRGDIPLPELEWLLSAADWSRVTDLRITGLLEASFSLSTLNALPSLVHLDLSSNRLLNATSSGGFAAAGRLETLNINANALTALRKELFEGMTRLSSLEINNNRLCQLDRDSFGELPALRILRVQGNHLTHIHPATFRRLTALTTLNIAVNDLPSLEASTFKGLSALTVLRAGTNPIGSLPPAIFDSLTSLTELRLAGSHLDVLPPNTFMHNTKLEILDLYRNHLSRLPADIFHGLTRVTLLDLGQNELRELPPAIFRDLQSVKDLFLDDNPLSKLPPGLLDACRHLDRLFMQRMGLRALPPGLFRNTLNVSTISLNDNRLTTVDEALDDLPMLRFVPLSNNRLKRFRARLPSLLVLDVSYNRMREIPDVSASTNMFTLRMRGHRVKQLDLTPLFKLNRLRNLEVDAPARINAVATVRAEELQKGDGGSLQTLTMSNVDMLGLYEHLLANAAGQLHTFHVGWRGMSESSLSMESLCRMLNNTVQEFSLTGTRFQRLELCADKDFASIFLQDNKDLTAVLVRDRLTQLNVSGCTALERLFVPSVETLDISRTRIRPTNALCTRWGQDMLFARDLISDEFEEVHAIRQLLSNCLQRVQVLDLSGNRWLDAPSRIAPVALQQTVLSSNSFFTVDGAALNSRVNPPLFQLEDAPIQCSLRLNNDNLREDGDSSFTLSVEVTYYFECVCAPRHDLQAHGRCEPRQTNVAAIVGASVMASLCVLVPLLVWVYRRYRRAHHSDDLHKQLLVRRDEEVMALKKAWEVGFDELRLQKRLASGAFGAVFKAEWDTVTVAVKVIQQSALDFDDTTVFEFEKEVEFLQRTRHPHVVRFFGAGTDPTGSPFLVLEYVALGSLKELLKKDMFAVLQGHVRERQGLESVDHRSAAGSAVSATFGATQNTNNSTSRSIDSAGHEGFSSSSSGGGGDKESMGDLFETSPEALRRTTTVGGGEEVYTESTTTEDFKLQLLRDVASGMAFIHSLGHVHRDLKSGNVLVSTRLRAKIADFGSIRQCLTRPRARSTVAVSTSPAAMDPMYSQAAGVTTIQLSMTAGVGTPLYMAPEVLAGAAYDAKADVFSFGVLMWEVAMQRTPDLICQEKGNGYRGPMLAALDNLLAAGRRLKFGDEGKELPQWYRDLTYKCMEQDPARRPTFDKLQLDYLLPDLGGRDDLASHSI